MNVNLCDDEVLAVKLIFYTAYLMCYNRLMSSLRAGNNPKVAVEVTAAVREELINYLSAESERGTMN